MIKKLRTAKGGFGCCFDDKQINLNFLLLTRTFTNKRVLLLIPQQDTYFVHSSKRYNIKCIYLEVFAPYPRLDKRDSFAAHAAAEHLLLSIATKVHNIKKLVVYSMFDKKFCLKVFAFFELCLTQAFILWCAVSWCATYMQV